MKYEELRKTLRAPVRDEDLAAAIDAESLRNRSAYEGRLRARVILRVSDGYRVFDVATKKRLSPPRRGLGRALEDFASLDAGIVLAVW